MKKLVAILIELWIGCPQTLRTYLVIIVLDFITKLSLKCHEYNQFFAVSQKFCLAKNDFYTHHTFVSLKWNWNNLPMYVINGCNMLAGIAEN